jgi:hypothetical protein
MAKRAEGIWLGTKSIEQVDIKFCCLVDSRETVTQQKEILSKSEPVAYGVEWHSPLLQIFGLCGKE